MQGAAPRAARSPCRIAGAAADERSVAPVRCQTPAIPCRLTPLAVPAGFSSSFVSDPSAPIA